MSRLKVYDYTNAELAEHFRICAPGSMRLPVKLGVITGVAEYSGSLRDFYLEHGTLQGSGVYGTMTRGSTTLTTLNRLLQQGFEQTFLEVKGNAEAITRVAGCSGLRTPGGRAPRFVPGSPSGAGLRASECGYSRRG